MAADGKRRLADAVDHEGVIALAKAVPNNKAMEFLDWFTFFDRYDLNGKTIYPFTTHEGSGLGSCVNDVRRAYPNASVQKGFSIYGHGLPLSATFVRLITPRSMGTSSGIEQGQRKLLFDSLFDL